MNRRDIYSRDTPPGRTLYENMLDDPDVKHTTPGRTLYENMLDNDRRGGYPERAGLRGGRSSDVTTDQPYGKDYIELKIARGGSDDDKLKDAFRSDRFPDEFKQYLRGMYLKDSPKDIGEARLDAVIKYLTDSEKKSYQKNATKDFYPYSTSGMVMFGRTKE